MTRRTMLKFLLSVSAIGFSSYLFLQQKLFGKHPTGSRLDRIKKSPNFRDGVFQNLSPTEVSSNKDASTLDMLRKFIFGTENVKPPKPIPSVKTDLKNLIADTPTIVWFGHSSYFIKSKNTTVLIDPVFSGNASPVSFMVKAFEGSNTYGVDDMPDIDMLILSHDHYDHLDYQTITKLIPKIKKFYTALGVGEHLELWGVKPENIIEFDWMESHQISSDINLTATPARHFSGRSFARAKSLWVSFVLKIHGYNIFLGGDSGYDTHFKMIGDKFGPFDFALLENGQYNLDWHYIHTLPEETAQAAQDLNVKIFMPVHWAKFPLAFHAWDEPIIRLQKSVSEKNLKMTTPMIGEPVILDKIYPDTTWWEA
ncbi:MAG: MBL fold metallo-hydrolase [Arcicella sp.]|nr:MBL fold metallo-hydrolase [Arcicella sp.]